MNHTELLENISIDYPPVEASRKKESSELLEEFILHQGEAVSIEDIFLGKSYTEDGFTYFALKDLMDHLKRNDLKNQDPGHSKTLEKNMMLKIN